MASPSRETLAQADRLLHVFERRKPDGAYTFSDEDVRAFLPLVIMGLGESLPNPWPEPLQKVMEEFAVAAGIPAGATPDQVQKAMDGFYASRPLNVELLRAFQASVQEELKTGSATGAGADHARRFLGDVAAAIPLATTGKAPAGAIKAAAWRTGAKVELPRRPPKT